MRGRTIVALLALAGATVAAEIPRPAPDFLVPLPNGNLKKLADYRGKVLCLTFILTT
ncbi:MAG TPA: hypothetical protein VMH80_07260 [Bryobacteraceae bacterium]|nr:hypothetical protein [Bryobacteraceae bacterium]